MDEDIIFTFLLQLLFVLFYNSFDDIRVSLMHGKGAIVFLFTALHFGFT